MTTSLAALALIGILVSIPMAEQLCLSSSGIAVHLKIRGYTPKAAINLYAVDGDEERVGYLQEWTGGRRIAVVRSTGKLACIVAEGSV